MVENKNKHLNKPAVIACHGSSLSLNKQQIELLQKEGKIIRFSTNNWFDFFTTKPDYWILASSVDTVENLIDKINIYKVPVMFADSVDLTRKDFLEERVKAEYFTYDQRHFKNRRCLEILKSFKEEYEKTKKIKYKEYGNNDVMWRPPRLSTGAGFDTKERCCKNIIVKRLTIQEQLQEASNHNEHYSTGDTVALHMIAFAIIMGCNPIYLSGMDLDYKAGYANNMKTPDNDDWQRLQENLLNDLRILNESAEKRGIKIINLNKDAWYNQFEKGEIK